MIILVMGAAGCGKSTIGSLLASRLGSVFLDADQLHDAASKEKMAAGAALTDADRLPWLAVVHDLVEQHARADQDLVFACSALKHQYRQLLQRDIEGMLVVFLEGAPGVLAERIRRRPGHFFPASLLADQLAILEAPDDERTLRLDITEPPEVLVERILAWLDTSARPAPARNSTARD